MFSNSGEEHLQQLQNIFEKYLVLILESKEFTIFSQRRKGVGAYSVKGGSENWPQKDRSNQYHSHAKKQERDIGLLREEKILEDVFAQLCWDCEGDYRHDENGQGGQMDYRGKGNLYHN